MLSTKYNTKILHPVTGKQIEFYSKEIFFFKFNKNLEKKKPFYQYLLHFPWKTSHVIYNILFRKIHLFL